MLVMIVIIITTVQVIIRLLMKVKQKELHNSNSVNGSSNKMQL